MEELSNTSQGKAESTLTGIGERLKAAREALNLSEKEAASRLRLNPKFIDMMETENFEKNLPPTFIKGYLRSYAKLLNVHAHEINAAIEKLDFTLIETTSMTTTTVNPSRFHLDQYLRWSSYFIISFLLLLVFIWWVTHPRFIDTPPLPVKTVSAAPIAPNLNEATSPAAVNEGLNTVPATTTLPKTVASLDNQLPLANPSLADSKKPISKSTLSSNEESEESGEEAPTIY